MWGSSDQNHKVNLGIYAGVAWNPAPSAVLVQPAAEVQELSGICSVKQVCLIANAAGEEKAGEGNINFLWSG